MSRICGLAIAAVVGVGASGASAAVPTSCSPQFSTASYAIAPRITVVRTAVGRGTCPSGIRVSSRGPTGVLWGTDWKNDLWRSSDDMASWQLAWVAAGEVQVEQVLQLRSGYVLVVVRDKSGYRHILRSTDTQGTAFSTAPALSMPADAWVQSIQSWVETGGAVYVGEYGYDDPATRHIWKSTNDGASFSTVYTIAKIRHIEAVQPDPYVPGRLWATTGDAPSEGYIGYSDDGAHSFKWITQGSYPLSRTVALMFTPTAVYWASDTPDVQPQLDRWDRSSGQITTVLSNLVGTYRLTVPYGNVLASFSAVESKSRDGYIGDDRIHVVSSGDGGATWAPSDTPWIRAPGNDTAHALPVGITPPDASNRVWISYDNLAGAVGYISNFELQLGDNFTGASATTTAVVAKGSVAPIKVSCPAGTNRGCTGVARLLTAIRRGGRRVVVGGGHRAFSAAPGQTVAVRVHLSRRVLRLLARRHHLRIRVIVTASDGLGLERMTSTVLTLKLRHRSHR